MQWDYVVYTIAIVAQVSYGIYLLYLIKGGRKMEGATEIKEEVKAPQEEAPKVEEQQIRIGDLSSSEFILLQEMRIGFGTILNKLDEMQKGKKK